MFAGLRSLETLWLFNNLLSSLPRAAFFELSELTELRLTNNRLSSLEEGMFIGLSTLQSLHLNGNRLTSLPDRVFAGMPVLEEMPIESKSAPVASPERLFPGCPCWPGSGCTRTGWRPPVCRDGVFSDLTSLWFLDLDNNQLTRPLGRRVLRPHFAGKPRPVRESSDQPCRRECLPGCPCLFSLWLHGNPVDPLQLIISLESAGEGRFRARAHTGAPFEMVLPITVANGNMDGGSSVTICPWQCGEPGRVRNPRGRHDGCRDGGSGSASRPAHPTRLRR